MTSIDWDALREVAKKAMAHAYAPYSKFPVGAAALTEDGRIAVSYTHLTLPTIYSV